MKRIASALIAILALAYIFSTQGYFDASSFKVDRAAFAYADGYDSSTVAKPIDISSNKNVKKKDASLRLMTYNIHRGISKSGKLDLNSTAATIREAAPGIVALQEVERFSVRTSFKDQIRYLASQLGMNYAYGKSINIFTGEYGNGLLSKYPIEEYKVYNLPSMKEQRTVLRAVVNIEGYRLAVYNVHLGLNQAEREAQVSYIGKLLKNEQLDYVLMGDMNSEVKKLAGIKEIAKDSAEGSVKLSQSTFEESKVHERIDYIFISEKLEAEDYDVIVSEASDHYPVVSDIKVQR